MFVINSIPRKIANTEIAIPKQPMVIPNIITNPSRESMPNEAIKMPRPGIQFDNGIGKTIKLENKSIKKPVIFSANGFDINKHLGLRNLSILRITDEDFWTIIAKIDLLTARLANLFGRRGEGYPINI